MKTEDFLENLRQCGGKVLTENKGSMSIVAKGTVKIYPDYSSEDQPIEMHDYPELSVNLIFVNWINWRCKNLLKTWTCGTDGWDTSTLTAYVV